MEGQKARDPEANNPRVASVRFALAGHFSVKDERCDGMKGAWPQHFVGCNFLTINCSLNNDWLSKLLPFGSEFVRTSCII